MIPPAHFLASWLLANSLRLNQRDRMLVTVVGVIPDLDGLGYPVERWTENWDHPLTWYSDWHHELGHNIGFAAIVAAGALIASQGNWRTTLLAIASFHLHLVCDLIGSRGQDGYQWPIPYLQPFSSAWQWTWSGQWELGAWQNRAIGVALFAATGCLAWRRGFSPFEIVSARADAACVRLLRRWGPKTNETPP